LPTLVSQLENLMLFSLGLSFSFVLERFVILINSDRIVFFYVIGDYVYFVVIRVFICIYYLLIKVIALNKGCIVSWLYNVVHLSNIFITIMQSHI
jgi:hypothetical protein